MTTRRPRLNATDFARRRQRLLAQMEPNSIAILHAGFPPVRNRDVEHAHRPDSDFFYLTGFPEAHAIAVLLPNREHGEYVLFCEEKDPAKELWTGLRVGPEQACARFGADDAFPLSAINDILPGLIEGRSRVYHALGKDPQFDRRVLDWVNLIRSKVRNGAHPPGEFVSLEHLLHELRLFKERGEVRLMRHAAEISARAHIRAMQACKPGSTEYELEAELLHEFMHAGARFPAYPPIVGGGENGCILHYTENSDRLKRGELVLIDAGCEFDCYAADITRTFPVTGRFSRTQRALYEIVLEAQVAAIEMVRPGRHWNEPHQAAVSVLADGLRALGLLKGSLKKILKDETFRRFYMHRTGHWLGMDVHDVGEYKVEAEWREFEPGMVLTVEPGIYVAPGERSVAARWQGIGIRIEDDVLVPADGCDVLSKDAPKTVADIQQVMAA